MEKVIVPSFSAMDENTQQLHLDKRHPGVEVAAHGISHELATEPDHTHQQTRLERDDAARSEPVEQPRQWSELELWEQGYSGAVQIEREPVHHWVATNLGWKEF